MLAAPLAAWSVALAAPAPTTAEEGAQLVSPGQVYRAVRTDGPMKIDGLAHEAVWSLAPEDDGFIERQPELGAKPDLRTSVRIAYDDKALYFLIVAEADPDGIVVRTLRRDNFGIFADDSVVIKLDPNHDGRTAYALGINADGAQIDTLSLEDGRQMIRQWDAVWQAEVHRERDRFTAEFRIPFAILGLKGGGSPVIGLSIARDQQSRNATYDWALITPPRSPLSASAFGDLIGLEGIEPQRALEMTPYLVLRSDFRPSFSIDPRERPNIAAGGEARIQVGGASYIEASLLTDFAQVEADQVQVARDRFPLFFPERRPFFINGLDTFNFGREKEAQLFFSRKVGLVEGAPVALLGGAKAYGREGNLSYGLLHVQTLGSEEDEGRGLPDAQPESVSVGRLRYQATDVFNLGVMALGQHRFGVDDEDSVAGGVDGQVIALDGKLLWYGFLASTFTQNPTTGPTFDEDSGELTGPGSPAHAESGQSAHTFLEYRGLYVRPSVLWLWSDEDFDPRLGFYRRPGTARQQGKLSFAPRPRFLGLRDVVFGPRYSVTTTPDYARRLTQEAEGEIKLNWRSGASVEYQTVHFVDDVQEPFELYLHTIDAGRYTGFRHKAELKTPGRWAFAAEASYEYVDLFGGMAHQPSLQLTAKVTKHFTVSGRYTHVVGHFLDPDQTFNFGFANGNMDVAFTRNLAWDSLLRLDLSPGNQRMGVQSRFRWRFLPGSDLFLVYRTDQPLGADPAGEEPRKQFHELTLKLTYYFRRTFAR